VTVTVTLLAPLSRDERAALEDEVVALGRFFGVPAELHVTG
jgi:hypothetical protein